MSNFEEEQQKINKMQSDLNIGTKKLIDLVSEEVDQLKNQIAKLQNQIRNNKLN
tara:strand:- start:1142 stop:1303 length:162 start_codon:yes stop_codon:yes gene_type:complete